MSTRAIVTATSKNTWPDKDGKEETRIEHWSLYCHGDGYPNHLGKLVLDFAELAPGMDPNNHENFNTDSWDKMRKSGYDPYAFVPNVSGEADKFIAALAGYLWQQGYTSAYMTNRDAREEATEEHGTDIQWLYEVTFPDHKPKVETLKHNYKEHSFSLVEDKELAAELKR